MTASAQTNHFNLHVNGVGYVNRVRWVEPRRNAGRRAEPFLACSVSAIRGNAESPDYTYFDLRVSGSEAIEMVERLGQRHGTVSLALGDGQQPHAAVVRVGVALHEGTGLQPVDHAADSGRVEANGARQGALVDTRLAQKLSQVPGVGLVTLSAIGATDSSGVFASTSISVRPLPPPGCSFSSSSANTSSRPHSQPLASRVSAATSSGEQIHCGSISTVSPLARSCAVPIQ